MNLKESLTKEYKNSHIDQFLVGVYTSSTPFSEARFQINIPNRISDNLLRIRKEELREIEPTFLEGLFYAGGYVIGLVGIPVDAVLTLYNILRDKSLESKVANSEI